MSCVTLIASDKPLPLCSCREPRTKIVHTGAAKYTVSLPCGFQVSEHCYYRQAVDELDLPIRLFQYELSLTPEESDLRNLQDYLRTNCSPGDCVQLWSLWVGGPEDTFCPLRRSGTLEELSVDVLKLFLAETPCWLEITI